MSRAPRRMPLRDRLLADAGGALLTSLMRTVRYDLRDDRSFREWTGAGRPALWVLWHGRLLPCSFWGRGLGLGTLISHHRDGDLIARIVEGWGFRVVRGSSSRGGAGALRDLVRLLQEGVSVAVTPDGPRGPRQTMKTGPLVAAQLAGVPLLPVSAGGDRAWWFEGWDRFMVPKPFARVRLAYGEPFHVPPEAGEAELEEMAKAIEARLNRLTDEVDGRE